MAVEYLLQENGDKILLEGTGALILESAEPATGFTARRYPMWYRIYANGIAFILWLTT